VLLCRLLWSLGNRVCELGSVKRFVWAEDVIRTVSAGGGYVWWIRIA
jgi:hypothetical protein